MHEFTAWLGTIQWAPVSASAIIAAAVTGIIGFIVHIYNKRAALQAQRNQFKHELDLQRQQLKHSESQVKIEVLEKFIRALRAAYKDLEQLKFAADGIQANGRHSRYYSEKRDYINAEKFEERRGDAIDKNLEVWQRVDQHVETLDSILLSITGVAPEFRNDAQDAIRKYKGETQTLNLLPEGDTPLKYYNIDEQKWNRILATIRGDL